MTVTLNDNADGSRPPNADAHGRAALLLVESLLHGLIARNVIAIADAVEIVAVAAEVAEESAHDRGADPESLAGPIVLLEAIGTSLAIDLPSSGPTIV
ncbi:hypothetical protein GCM10022280_25120 [Sphingomonas swuensis]|uniref:Uncharacterized protein n=1 Tax=Sphingomonas swuensis TaxID=977800 RepID=A0ABP7TA88_9SPHN